MMYKRRCSWRGEIKQRTSGKTLHHRCFLSSVPDHGFLHTQKQKSREKREARLFPSWQELHLCTAQRPTKSFTGITVRIAAGADASLRVYISPRWSSGVQVMGQGCCQLVRVLPCMKGTPQLCSYSGWPEGPQFRFSHSIPLSIGNVIHTTFTEQENIMKMPADMND